MAAAAPPPEAVLAAMAEAGFDVVHVYGLTEVYGPAVVNEWHDEWDALDSAGRAAKKARQGVRYHPLEELAVLDPKTMKPVPADGKTIGEVMFRGNIVMKGYLKNPKATARRLRGRLVSFRRSGGDVSRRLYPAQGPLQGHHHFRRREHLLHRGGECHRQASRRAVRGGGGAARREMGRDVLAPLSNCGPARAVTEDEILAFCREQLAKFKVPRTVVFAELPKTSTGKIQKFVLREHGEELCEHSPRRRR